ncbi:MAG: sulfite exporter TauE/SafE family protein [Paracoccaceae bacterium]
MTMSIETLTPVLLTYMLAGLVKGAMGFGLPIVAIALLPMFVPVDTALALNAIVVIATNVNQIVQGGQYRDGLSVAWPLVLGMALAIPPTAILAAGLSADTLLLIVGVSVLIFIAISLVNPALSVPQVWRRPAGLGFGLLGGIVGALTSAPAAALAPYMIALHLPRPVYITALGYLLTGFGVIVALSYASVDILHASHVLPALASVPIAIAGMWIGDRWARRLANETFRRAVLALLAVLAIALIRRSLG